MSELDKLAQRARAPRAAGIAGIAFSVLFFASIGLFRASIPFDPDDPGTWLTSDAERSRVRLALALIPFAGIAFLWFIGVIRDRLGDREDRFFATVFLGSGLLFVATLFICGALMGTLVGLAESEHLDPEVWQFGRRLVFTVTSTYALRMAAVFIVATTTLTRRLGVLPRGLGIVGYLSAVALLVGATRVPWSEMVFPVWVLLFSIWILRRGAHAEPSEGVHAD